VKSSTGRLIFLAAVLFGVILLAALIATAPKNPVALIRVVDAAGKPVAGAIIQPEGMRTKSGPYVSGWYGWRSEGNGVANPPVMTDRDGYAQIPYPKFVFERIETGTLCLAVTHPEFVPDRPERIVATAPPAGAPWKMRLEDLWGRIRHKALLARPATVVLQKGAILKIAVQPDAAISGNAHLFAQVSGEPYGDTNFWIRPDPDVIVTRRLAAGPHTARAIRLDAAGTAWFSDVTSITAAIGQTNELSLALKPGITVQGQLDGTVPRPVKNGRVVAHVTPAGAMLQHDPPQWHAWAAVQEDGTFVLNSLPEGELEIVALVDGFVSINGPGQAHMRYPHKHVLGTNDLVIPIRMEPTARLEVNVTDNLGHPLKDARVMTWPNVRYGEWSATILMSDCYNTSDNLLMKPEKKFAWGRPVMVMDFQGVSDSAGRAVLPNLPPDVTELAVEHAQFELPIVTSPDGRKQRQASFTLVAGQTNRISLQLEPRERSTIAHY
jgi:hypothetical protein